MFKNVLATIPEIPSAGDYRCKPQHFEDPLLLVSKLQNEHSENFLYRGQTERRCRRWPSKDRMGFKAECYVFDSILPTDYRGLESLIAKGRNSDDNELQEFNQRILRIRYAIMFVAIVLAEEGVETPVGPDWLNSAPREDVRDLLGGVGQHYGLKTRYIDVSSSWTTALWFATMDCATQSPHCSGTGIIYRFSQVHMDQAERYINSFPNRRPNDRAKRIDLGATPSGLAPRLSAQSGWSLKNYEHPFLMAALKEIGAIECFSFTRSEPPLSSIPSSEELFPKPDRMLDAVADACTDRCRESVQEVLNQHYNGDAPQSNRIEISDADWADATRRP